MEGSAVTPGETSEQKDGSINPGTRVTERTVKKGVLAVIMLLTELQIWIELETTPIAVKLTTAEMPQTDDHDGNGNVDNATDGSATEGGDTIGDATDTECNSKVVGADDSGNGAGWAPSLFHNINHSKRCDGVPS